MNWLNSGCGYMLLMVGLAMVFVFLMTRNKVGASLEGKDSLPPVSTGTPMPPVKEPLSVAHVKTLIEKRGAQYRDLVNAWLKDNPDIVTAIHQKLLLNHVWWAPKEMDPRGLSTVHQDSFDYARGSVAVKFGSEDDPHFTLKLSSASIQLRISHNCSYYVEALEVSEEATVAFMHESRFICNGEQGYAVTHDAAGEWRFISARLLREFFDSPLTETPFDILTRLVKTPTLNTTYQYDCENSLDYILAKVSAPSEYGRATTLLSNECFGECLSNRRYDYEDFKVANHTGLLQFKWHVVFNHYIYTLFYIDGKNGYPILESYLPDAKALPECLLKLGHCKVRYFANLATTLMHTMSRNQKQPELE
jgi:hypothetical protein